MPRAGANVEGIMAPMRVLLACSAVLPLLSCTTESDTRSDTRDRQLEEALRYQDMQYRIEDFARGLPCVESASVRLRPGAAVVTLTFRAGSALEPDAQEKLNLFITELTGVPRSGIALMVPERSVPGRNP